MKSPRRAAQCLMLMLLFPIVGFGQAKVIEASDKNPVQQASQDVEWRGGTIFAISSDAVPSLTKKANCDTSAGCESSFSFQPMSNAWADDLGENCSSFCEETVACCDSRFNVFGESLFLRSRDVEVPYAVPVDGPITPLLTNGIQIGPTAVIDQDFSNGFRVGFGVDGPGCSSLMARWTRFLSHEATAATIASPDVMRSLVAHPLGNNAAADGLQATADYDIDFDLIDLVASFSCFNNPCGWCTDLMLGVRYADLNQEFTSTIDVNGTTQIDTDVDFHGIGPMIGIRGNRNVGCRGGFLYGMGAASFLAGGATADYTQQDAFSGTVVDTRWESNRIVSILDAEFGFGWASPCGRINMSTGYLVSAWFNTVKSADYVDAVRFNSYDNLGSGITFDGLVGRVTVSF